MICVQKEVSEISDDCENRIMPSITNRFLYCNYFTERVKVLENYKEKLYYRFKETNIRSKIKEGIHMDYKRVTLQMLKRLRGEIAWKKLYTFVKVLMEQQGD